MSKLLCRKHVTGAMFALAAMAFGFATLPASAEEPTRGGRLSIALSPEPPTVMLGVNGSGPAQLVGGKIFDGLLTYSQSLEPMPRLAKTWEISPDGLRYTFNLEEGVKWHDGKPMTSADVVFSLRDFLSQTNPRARILAAAVVGYEAPDDHTVVFTLSKPFPAFISGFDVSTVPILPKHIYEGTDFRTNPANEKPIGTGPFKFEEWRKGEYLRLVRNEDYWKEGKPYLDEIVFRVIPDAASRLAALESGEIDLASNYDIDPVHTPLLQQNPQLVVTNEGYEYLGHISWLEFNNRVKPLDDVRFRQAVMHALDRDFMAQRIWFNNAIPATGPVASVTKYYEPNVASYPLDLAKATALLDEMGLKPDANGVRATLKLMQLPNGEVWTRMAEYIRESLGKIGVTVQLEAVDSGTWVQRVGNWDYEMTINVLGQYADPAIGIARSYVSSNIRQGVPFTNTEGYVNEKVDELFAQAASTNDEAERTKAYSDVQKILVDEVPVAWLLQVRFPTVYNVKFANVVSSAIGVVDNFDSVYIRE